MSSIRLGEIGKISMCKRILKSQTNEFSGIPFYKISTFGGTPTVYIDEKIYREYKEKYSYPKKGDILISAAGTIGKTVIFDGEDSYFQDSNIVWIENDESKVTNQFLYYFLQTNPFITTNGSTIKRLYNDNLRDTKIPNVPSIQQQNQITDILGTLDKKIQTNNQINQELEAMAKTLYDYWFVQFDFPDQNGKPYKSSGGKMVYNPELKREIPEGWGVEKLENLGTIVGGSTPTKSISDNFTKGGEGYSWITPNDLSNNKGNKFIKNGEIDVTVRGLKDAGLKLYPEGTVLMSSRAPVGYLAISTKEITTNQGFKSFIPDKKYGKNYIYYTLQNNLKVIEQHASGSTFKEISATVLKDITIIQPNLDIVKKFEEKVSSINSYIKVNEEQKQELTQVRDWLLPMLMNGQVKAE
ncbi:restriction endonuclease subunit S [Streptococcus thermophilus]|uniref:restriction endonuclease subunit S n=1 Tax=Streptococcus thermophilus TaxID=1308 RepID=UPI00321FB9A9